MNSKFTQDEAAHGRGGLSLFGHPRSLDPHQCARRMFRLFVRAGFGEGQPTTPTERPGTIARAAPVRVAIAEPRARQHLWEPCPIIRTYRTSKSPDTWALWPVSISRKRRRLTIVQWLLGFQIVQQLANIDDNLCSPYPNGVDNETVRRFRLRLHVLPSCCPIGLQIIKQRADGGDYLLVVFAHSPASVEVIE